jgi:NAD dependent epimerase/dehydratase
VTPVVEKAIWGGRRVLVTGAEGFVGSTLVERLLAAGADVRALVHYKPYGRAGFLAGVADQIEVVAGDVRDAGMVDGAVAGREVVFHLAALVGIPYSYLAPEAYVQTNVVGSHNVAQAARRHEVERVVHTSTSEVYGSARRVPIDESHPLQPQSPYSASKIAADMMMLSYRNALGVPVSVVRPFNVYGPRQSARAVIPTILAQLHAGSSEVRLGALSPTRDYTFVEDTVAGFLAVAAHPDTIGAVVNVGSGREISIGDLAARLIEIVGTDAVVVSDRERERPATSEVDRLLCDNAAARAIGWAPRVSLDAGLRRTSDWVADHLAEFDTTSYQR